MAVKGLSGDEIRQHGRQKKGKKESTKLKQNEKKNRFNELLTISLSLSLSLFLFYTGREENNNTIGYAHMSCRRSVSRKVVPQRTFWVKSPRSIAKNNTTRELISKQEKRFDNIVVILIKKEPADVYQMNKHVIILTGWSRVYLDKDRIECPARKCLSCRENGVTFACLSPPPFSSVSSRHNKNGMSIAKREMARCPPGGHSFLFGRINYIREFNSVVVVVVAKGNVNVIFFLSKEKYQKNV
jgi:hypothetical protein